MIDRLEHRQEVIEALTDAQKIAFAPISFQAVAALLEFGILKLIDEKPESPFVIKEELNLSEYTVKTLLEVAETLGLVISDEEVYSITELGKMFLYNDMTIANFKFVKDVCYKGAEKLTDSFLKGEAEGLKLMYPKAKTIYPYLSKLPENMKNSWFEFDHYYSNNCFDIIYKIILDKAIASRYDDINPKQKTVCGIIPNKALSAKTIKDAQMRRCFCSLFP